MSSKSMNIDINEWQIEEIKKAIAEADAGDLVDHAVVEAYFKKRIKEMKRRASETAARNNEKI